MKRAITKLAAAVTLGSLGGSRNTAKQRKARLANLKRVRR